MKPDAWTLKSPEIGFKPACKPLTSVTKIPFSTVLIISSLVKLPGSINILVGPVPIFPATPSLKPFAVLRLCKKPLNTPFSTIFLVLQGTPSSSNATLINESL